MRFLKPLAAMALIFATIECTAEASDIPNVPGFSLPTAQKNPVKLSTNDHKQFTVVCFLGAECPLARLYGRRLEEIQATYKKQLRVIGVNSNAQDSMDDVRSYVDELKLTFPIGKDFKNVVADRFGATRTPEVFLLDANLRVHYRGCIDDQYLPGITKAQPTQRNLIDAIDRLIAGKKISVPVTEPNGCLIGRTREPVKDSQITFTKQIAGVLQKHCVECHRPGDIGPFQLTDYEEVSGWADMIVEVIDDGRMPPWHANPNHGDFANARHMPESDKQLIRDWVKAGAPYGDPGELPKTPEYVGGWQFGRQPDQVVAMQDQPYIVPPEGTVEYQYFVVDPGFEEDKWVSAAQIIPGDRSVVHHVIAFIRPPDGQWFRGIGWLTAYVPGQRMIGHKNGYARRIPAKSKIVFQMHYTPNGKPAEDISKLGLMFADESEVTHEVFTMMAINQDFEIPPHSANHKVTASIEAFPKHGELLGMAPHMHVRGRSFQVFANSKIHSPGKNVLLDVPRYDFNWQHSYLFRKPIPLDTLRSIEFSAGFDNSDNNPVNPDPKQHVMWGDQTWEEMAVAFFEVAEPRDKESTNHQEGDSKATNKKSPAKLAKEQQLEKKAMRFATDFMSRYDTDKDGFVHRDDLPKSLRRIGWNSMRADANGDSKLTKDELLAAARRRYLRK